MSRTGQPRPRLVYVITAPMSARHLLKGQLHWMASQGWDVHLVCGPGPDAEEAARREGVTLHTVPLSREIDPRTDGSSLLALVRLLRRLRPDVVNVSTPKAGLLGGLAARLVGVPRRVYVVRGLRYQGATGRRRQVLMAAERAALACATDVVAVSHSIARSLVDDGLCTSAPHVIGAGSSNGVDAEALTAAAASAGEPPEMAELRRAHPDRQLVMFVGRMTRDKGMGELAAAVRQAQGRHHLVTVGPTDEELSEDFAALQASGWWTAVPYTPVVAPWTAAADVLALPSYREGLPNVVLEAAALSVPAVVSDADGCRDAVQPSRTGLVVPVGEIAPLVEALDALRDDPQGRAAMGAAASTWVREAFVPADIWQGLDALYKQPA